MLFVTPPLAGLAFLPFVLPIAIWVAWSDMKKMKIHNEAVLALALVFLVVGPFVLPLGEWAFRWLHLVLVLVVGFLANMARLVGAGDAKFAAAMAPFVAAGDVQIFLVLFAAVLIAAYVTHRGARAIPPLRRALADWASWERRDFPMGLALGGVLAIYLLLAALD